MPEQHVQAAREGFDGRGDWQWTKLVEQVIQHPLQPPRRALLSKSSKTVQALAESGSSGAYLEGEIPVASSSGGQR
jgi:hypothetical protein